METLALPRLVHDGDAGFQHVLRARKTVREFKASPLNLDCVSHLLFAAQGEIGERRTTPSAGAFYPIQLWLCARAVSGLDAGVYMYGPAGRTLTSVRAGDVTGVLCDAALEDQPWIGDAAAVIAILADVGAICEQFREQPPEGERGRRYADMEAGACAQNIYLQCAADGIGGVLVAGFNDAEIKSALGSPDNLEPMILFCVGHPGD